MEQFMQDDKYFSWKKKEINTGALKLETR